MRPPIPSLYNVFWFCVYVAGGGGGMCRMDTGQQEEGRALILDSSSELSLYCFPVFPFAQSSSKSTACAQRRTRGLREAQTLPVQQST